MAGLAAVLRELDDGLQPPPDYRFGAISHGCPSTSLLPTVTLLGDRPCSVVTGYFLGDCESAVRFIDLLATAFWPCSGADDL